MANCVSIPLLSDSTCPTRQFEPTISERSVEVAIRPEVESQCRPPCAQVAGRLPATPTNTLAAAIPAKTIPGMVPPPIPWRGDESSRAAICVPQIGVRGAFLARAAHYREGTADSSTDTTDISEFPCALVYTHVSVSIFGPIVYQEWLVSVSRTVGYCIKSGWRVRRDALRTHRERREMTSSIVGKYAVRRDCLG